MKWFETSWEQLTPNQVHAMIRLRLDVFVVEQDCVYADLDGKDLDSVHLWCERPDAEPGEAAEAVVRLLPPGLSYDVPSIGRVACKETQRGTGLGQELMERSVRACQRLWPQYGVQISAQQYLVGFYESIGFQSIGEGYLEDNIPHIGMVRPWHSWDHLIGAVSEAALEFEAVYRGLAEDHEPVVSDGWTKAQVLKHLIASESSLFAYMQKKSQASPETLPALDLDSDGRGVKLVRDLKSDMRWEDPTGGIVSPEGVAEAISSDDDLIALWNASRAAGFQRMRERMTHDTWWSVQLFRHPIAGYISLYDTFSFMAAHIRHHIYQLQRLDSKFQDKHA